MYRYPCMLSLNFFRRLCSHSSLTVVQTLLKKPIDQKILVQGWVQAIRKYKDLYFVDLIDGTCLERLQIVIPAENEENIPKHGSSIKVEGSLVKSPYQGQEVELVADSWETIGFCAEDYPFAYRTKYTSEQIRQFPHLRSRTRRFSSIIRVRNHASMAVHEYFQDQGYHIIHTPVITQNDCEGAGEVFSIGLKQNAATASLDTKGNTSTTNATNNSKNSDPSDTRIRIVNKNSDPTGTASTPANGDLEHFFGAPVHLTVSGQLHLEAMACSFGGGVYSFGPTFRAESSRTRQHACEFQMIEAEIAFITRIEDLIKVVENCIKKIIESIMKNCADEVQFLSQDLKNHDSYINNLVSKPFIQMTYEESISILEKSNDPIKFGEDLSAKHKAFLIKYCDSIPVFVSMFPSTIKPFYMKTNENNLAYCFDLFASHGGEICGGSLREEDAEKLKTKYNFDENSSLLWYHDLRKYGCPPHGGFGIGFERLLQSILGISNIRDVIPFPRRKYDCKC